MDMFDELKRRRPHATPHGSTQRSARDLLGSARHERQERQLQHLRQSSALMIQVSMRPPARTCAGRDAGMRARNRMTDAAIVPALLPATPASDA